MKRDFWALLVIVCFGVLAAQYARVMPVFEAADEGAHFLYTHNLLETGALPVILSREQVAVQESPAVRWAIETHQPPLYYAIGAALVFWIDRADIADYLRPNDLIFIRGISAENHNQWLHAPDRGVNGQTALALYLLRGYSIVLGMTTLWFIYRTACLLWERSFLPVVTVLFAASITTFASISASYNNDNLVTTLYAAGVYWSLRMWRRGRITRTDVIGMSAILAMIALTKLNGVTLFGVVYLALLIGVWRGVYPWRDAVRLCVMSLAVTAIFAGWWYVRNFDLYGDPLALAATQSLWGREFEIAATSGDIGAELTRIYRSFWMMMGYLHLPVYGPAWLYVYAGALTLVAVIGIAVTPFLPLRHSDAKSMVYFLLLVCAMVFVTLLIGTRSVDISYGRLLFPALVGFAPLVVWGWTTPFTADARPLSDENVLRGNRVRLKSGIRRVFISIGIVLLILLVSPLTIVTVSTPFTVIPSAYPTLMAVDAIPERASRIDASAEGLDLLAYTTSNDTVAPGETATFDLYLRGVHPDNPALLATLVNPISGERLGHTEIYPGSAPTDSLDPPRIYRFPVAVDLLRRDEPFPPQQARLRLEWLSPAADRVVPFTVAGEIQESLLLDATTIIDPRYRVLLVNPPQEPPVVYGEMIALVDYALEQEGNTLALTLYWEMVTDDIADDWTLAVQLIDSDTGDIVDQADGIIPGYPTSAWQRTAGIVADERRLMLPADVTDYHILLGWYNPTTRLTAVGEPVTDNLYRLEN